MNRQPVALVVDDSPELRLLMSSMCRSLGLQVVAARDGDAALAVVGDTTPDIVCLDLMLPTMSGFEVCERLRARPETANVPVLMASVRSCPQDRAEAELAGADAYLTKPINREEFTAQVRSLLWRQRGSEQA